MTPSPAISEAQLAANRANATLSTGPATAEAKTRTRLNELRHGLTGQTVFLPGGFKTASIIEKQMAQQVADAYWRLDRINAIENNIFALGIESHDGEFRDDPEGNAAPARRKPGTNKPARSICSRYTNSASLIR
jgi:hypothetical protein